MSYTNSRTAFMIPTQGTFLNNPDFVKIRLIRPRKGFFLICSTKNTVHTTKGTTTNLLVRNRGKNLVQLLNHNIVQLHIKHRPFTTYNFGFIKGIIFVSAIRSNKGLEDLHSLALRDDFLLSNLDHFDKLRHLAEIRMTVKQTMSTNVENYPENTNDGERKVEYRNGSREDYWEQIGRTSVRFACSLYNLAKY